MRSEHWAGILSFRKLQTRIVQKQQRRPSKLFWNCQKVAFWSLSIWMNTQSQFNLYNSRSANIDRKYEQFDSALNPETFWQKDSESKTALFQARNLFLYCILWFDNYANRAGGSWFQLVFQADLSEPDYTSYLLLPVMRKKNCQSSFPCRSCSVQAAMKTSEALHSKFLFGPICSKLTMYIIPWLEHKQKQQTRSPLQPFVIKK